MVFGMLMYWNVDVLKYDMSWYLMIFHDICSLSSSCSAITVIPYTFHMFPAVNFQAHSRACAKSGLIRWGNLQGEMPGKDMPEKNRYSLCFKVMGKTWKDYIFWANYSKKNISTEVMLLCPWDSSNCHADQTFGHTGVYVPLGKSPCAVEWAAPFWECWLVKLRSISPSCIYI